MIHGISLRPIFEMQGDIVYAKNTELIWFNDVDQELIPGLVKGLSGFSYK